ncbi:MAG: hypothetical protein HY017_25060 [Betaproteobacteria bacterium]|nr:hypothetical protein [Betaproteobacteria bacterium]
MQQGTALDSTPRSLLTLAQFGERHPAFPPPVMRPHILNAEDRLNSRGEPISGNGLAEAGAIVRIGRRVLIDEQAFFRWIAEQQKRPKAKAAAA